MLTWDKTDERYFQTGIDRGVLYPTTPPPSEVITNLLINPDFESDIAPWASGLGSGAVSFDATDKRPGSAGTKSAKFVPVSGYDAFYPGYVAVDDSVASFGGWIKGPAGKLVWIRLGGNVGSWISDSGFYTLTGGWQFIGYTATPPAGTTLVYPAVFTVDLGTYRFDDLFFGNHDTPLDFNGGVTDDLLYRYDWTGTAHASTSTRTKLTIDPVVWNGITGVDDGGNGAHEVSYLDGKIFLADSDATDYSGKLTAFDFPDEFMVCIGMPQVVDGLILDNQKPKRFGLSYRSLIGSGLTGDQFGYQIHLVYNAFASIGATSRKTINNTASPIEFAFDLVATPVKLAGYRPTAHYILDTRRLDPETIDSLESILYGSDSTPGRLPTPTELFEMLNFGPNIDVVHNTTDETINFSGQRSNVFMTGTDSFQINNVNAVDNGDGTYTISDGGTTTVTVV